MTDRKKQPDLSQQEDQLEWGFWAPISSPRISYRKLLEARQKEVSKVLTEKSEQESLKIKISNHIKQFESERKTAWKADPKASYEYLERLKWFLDRWEISYQDLYVAQSDEKIIDENFLNQMRVFAANKLGWEKFKALRNQLWVDFDENWLGVRPDFILRQSQKKGFDVQLVWDENILNPRDNFEKYDYFLNENKLIKVTNETLAKSIRLKELETILHKLIDLYNFITITPFVDFFENEKNGFVRNPNDTHLTTTRMTREMVDSFKDLVLELTIINLKQQSENLGSWKSKVEKIRQLLKISDYLKTKFSILGMKRKVIDQNNQINDFLEKSLQDFS